MSGASYDAFTAAMQLCIPAIVEQEFAASSSLIVALTYAPLPTDKTTPEYHRLVLAVEHVVAKRLRARNRHARDFANQWHFLAMAYTEVLKQVGDERARELTFPIVDACNRMWNAIDDSRRDAA